MPHTSNETDWLLGLAERQPRAMSLLQAPFEEQRRRGYGHTLREIFQQPDTWLVTCEQMCGHAPLLKAAVTGAKLVLFTGSGSSEYAGDCVRLPLRSELQVDTQAISGGVLLTSGSQSLPLARPGLVVSLARSGDSPESAEALSLLLATEPQLHHLVLTCNSAGSLANRYHDNARVNVIALDERTNDRSLVMTSSFTNMALAARFLGLLDQPDAYRKLCLQLSGIVKEMLLNHFETFAEVAQRRYLRAVFLADGSRFGAARESALKVMEMTAGRVSTLYETYLGLRHGPMSFVQDDTLIVCFLSSDPLRRAYEADLLQELNRKDIGLAKLVIGDRVPKDLLRPRDLLIECAGLAEVGDENAPVVDVVAGQLLAFFRCLEEGLQPDSPSENGVINRVVERFTLHHRNAPGLA